MSLYLKQLLTLARGVSFEAITDIFAGDYDF